MSLPINEVVCGDCLEVLKTFPDESIDLTMFSPPYWGLRDYGISGQIGLEEHPSKYIEKMVKVCQEVKRVLKKTGSMYIVIGDTYFGSGGAGGQYKKFSPNRKEIVNDYKQPKVENDGKWLQPKQLMGIPWRVAIALQEDGWILRNDIIWNKPNHMPSSVTDRLTNAYEHIFHFVKSRKYYYDLDAIRERPVEYELKRRLRERNEGLVTRFQNQKCDGLANPPSEKSGLRTNVKSDKYLSIGKNPSDVYQGKFEGFGEESEKFGSPRARTQRETKLQSADNEVTKFMVERGSGGNLKNGGINSPEKQNDPDYRQYLAEKGKNPSDILETKDYFRPETDKPLSQHQKWEREGTACGSNENGKNPSDFWNITTRGFKGAHFAVYPEQLCIRPIKSSCPPNGIVLDLMCGSGTTLAVAKKLGRKYIGIDLNPKYVEIARKRLSTVPEKLETFMEERC